MFVIKRVMLTPEELVAVNVKVRFEFTCPTVGELLMLKSKPGAALPWIAVAKNIRNRIPNL